MKNEGIEYKIFNVINIVFMLLICAVVIFPYLNVLALAFNDSRNSALGGVALFPRIPTLDNFRALLMQDQIKSAFVVSTARVLIGVSIDLTVQFCAAYVLSRKGMRGKKLLTIYFMIPMYISGGLFHPISFITI